MVQKDKYDKLILCKIQNGDIIIIPDDGIIQGKIISNGKRKPIGSVLNSKKHFTILNNGKTVIYPCCRAIYLSRNQMMSG